MPSPGDVTIIMLIVALERSAPPFGLDYNESLAAMSANEAGGALIKGCMWLTVEWLKHTAVEGDRQMTSCFETRLLVTSGT
jgi:hypothetical protein